MGFLNFGKSPEKDTVRIDKAPKGESQEVNLGSIKNKIIQETIVELAEDKDLELRDFNVLLDTVSTIVDKRMDSGEIDTPKTEDELNKFQAQIKPIVEDNLVWLLK